MEDLKNSYQLVDSDLISTWICCFYLFLRFYAVTTIAQEILLLWSLNNETATVRCFLLSVKSWLKFEFGFYRLVFGNTASFDKK